MLVCLTGCAGMGRSQQTFRWAEPIESSRSSTTAPLGAQPGRVQRPASPRRPPSGDRSKIEPRQPQEAQQPNPTDSTDVDPGRHLEETDTPTEPTETEPRTSGKLSVPSIDLEEIIPIGELELEVRAPDQSAVDRLTTYHITLRNSTAEPANNLSVVCRLPQGVRFPGSDSDELAATTGRLEQGETKEWDLSLIADSSGSKCCVFRLQPEGHRDCDPPTVERKVCVEFFDRQFSLEILGPTKRVETDRAEFVINVGNPSDKPRERVQLQISFDRVFEPRDVTEGAVGTPGSPILTWDLGTLEAGAKRQIQVEFDCKSPARRACVRAEITSPGMEPEQEEACVEVAAQSGSLTVKLSDRVEPFRVGSRGIYDLRVKNLDVKSARKVAIEIRLPEELVVLSAKLKRGDEELEVQYSVRDDKLIFDPVDCLPADEELIGVIEVEGVSAGRVQLTASVTSSLNPQPATTSELTVIER